MEFWLSVDNFYKIPLNAEMYNGFNNAWEVFVWITRMCTVNVSMMQYNAISICTFKWRG